MNFIGKTIVNKLRPHSWLFILIQFFVLGSNFAYGLGIDFTPPLQRNPYRIMQTSLGNRALSREAILSGPQSKVIPYYSQFLYQAMHSRMQNEQLKYVLKSILRNKHVMKPGQLDDVVEACPAQNSNCYQQVNIGYDRARLFLLGYFYLVKNGGQYSIKEVYCNKLYGSPEFQGKKLPQPNFIPDDDVINVEHTWPQSLFTGQHPKDVQKADLHHLFPADSQLNGIRGNHPFGVVVRPTMPLKCGQSKFGSSDVSGRPTFEPPDEHKGHVARAIFYFSVRYDSPLDAEQEAVLRKWHEQHPVDPDELLRNDEIYKIQGNRNPFIDHPELVSSILDF